LSFLHILAWVESICSNWFLAGAAPSVSNTAEIEMNAIGSAEARGELFCFSLMGVFLVHPLTKEKNPERFRKNEKISRNHG